MATLPEGWRIAFAPSNDKRMARVQVTPPARWVEIAAIEDAHDRWDALMALPEAEPLALGMLRRIRRRTQAIRLAHGVLRALMGQRTCGSNGWR